MNSNYALVVIGYNRIPGMMRLLDSLNEAYYGDDRVTLIISLDNCGSDEVEKAANAFEWHHGEKRVRTFPTRQGLRKHILSCGDFLKEFEAIAVLEDDLYVAPDFYNYMKQTVNTYQNKEEIAGISLYCHKLNTNIQMPFIPQPSQYDVFFMQFAQSWGQVWMRNQWFAFKKWYESYEGEELGADNFPDCVARWPKTSWLKYHIKYCVEKNKYFVYPYHSLTTCFSDAGEHSKETNTVYQVPLQYGIGKHYIMAPSIEDGVCYDAFYERVLKEEQHCLDDIEYKKITMDLYGTKKEYKTKYVISTNSLPYRIVKTFGRIMKPHEENIFHKVEGNIFFLYDVEEKADYKHISNTEADKVSYYFNITAKWTVLLRYMVMRIKRKLEKN